MEILKLAVISVYGVLVIEGNIALLSSFTKRKRQERIHHPNYTPHGYSESDALRSDINFGPREDANFRGIHCSTQHTGEIRVTMLFCTNIFIDKSARIMDYHLLSSFIISWIVTLLYHGSTSRPIVYIFLYIFVYYRPCQWQPGIRSTVRVKCSSDRWSL